MASLEKSRARDQVEIARFEAAQRATFGLLAGAERTLSEGMTERDLADMLVTRARAAGAEGFYHGPLVYFGERTRRFYFPPWPSRRPLRRGDLVIMDVAPLFDGILGDAAVTVCFGVPTSEIVQSCRATADAVIATVAPGVPARQVYETFRTEAAKRRVEVLVPFLGHGVDRMTLGRFPLPYAAALMHHARRPKALITPWGFGHITPGLWTIEPHVGDRRQGAKFEDIILVTREGARPIGREVPA